MKRNILLVLLISIIGFAATNACASKDSTRESSTDINTDFDIDASIADSEPSETPYMYTGICGRSGKASVTPDTYVGTEDIYLVGGEGDGEDVCRVQFDVQSIGPPAATCDICDWAFTVEQTAYTVTADVDSGCAESELALTDAALESQIGHRFSLGYAAEDTGHAHVLLHLNDTTGIWEAVSVATWNPETGTFFYDRKDGFCGY